MPQPPRLHKPKDATIILKIVTNSKNYSEIWRKKIHISLYFVELVETNPLIY